METAPTTDRHVFAVNAAEGVIQLAFARMQPGENGTEELVPVFSQRWHVSGQGAEILVPALQTACELMHIPPASIQRIAAVSGPGSFTGIRLALGTAAGLARATGAEQAGIDYMYLLALNTAMKRGLFSGAPSAHITVLTHARRNLVHAQHFTLPDTMQAETLAAASALQVLTLEEVPAFIEAAACKQTRILGSGLSRNRTTLQETVRAKTPEAIYMPPAFDMPDEAALLKAAQRASYTTHDIQPQYARQSEAEDNFDDIARKLNLDQTKARAALERLVTP